MREASSWEAFFTAEGAKRLDFGGIPAIRGAAVFENSTACDHEARFLEPYWSRPGSTRRRAVFGMSDGQIQHLVKSEGCRHVYGGARQYGHDNSV
jgi:hypothetical protein